MSLPTEPAFLRGGASTPSRHSFEQNGAQPLVAFLSFVQKRG